MRYLITTNTEQPFLTEYYDHENHFNEELKMVVYDLYNRRYSNDGETWKDIQIDHL